MMVRRILSSDSCLLNCNIIKRLPYGSIECEWMSSSLEEFLLGVTTLVKVYNKKTLLRTLSYIYSRK